MTTRRYDHWCPLALALDLIGDRWALLVVRELLLGARRFSDLSEGLPGISTDVLSTRLRELEEAGVVLRRAESRSRWYELTDDGLGLRTSVQELARWGARRLTSEPPLPVPPHRTMAALSMHTETLLIRDAEGSFEILADGELFCLTVTAGHLTIRRDSAEPPRAKVELDGKSLFLLATGTPVASLIAAGAAVVTGDGRSLERLLTTIAFSGVFTDSPIFGPSGTPQG